MNMDVFCSCQMYVTYGDMVQCNLCGFISSASIFHLVQPEESLELFTPAVGHKYVLMNFTYLNSLSVFTGIYNGSYTCKYN